MKTSTDPDLILYSNCMVRLKYRVQSIQGLIEGSEHSRGVTPDVEFVALQIRKILECIALAGICAHRSDYERIRPMLHSDWNARLIVRELDRINPHWYPVPLEQEDGAKDPITGARPLIHMGENFLTKGMFEKLYKKMGALLHEDNPVAGMHKFDWNKEWSQFPERLTNIVRLTGKHRVFPKPKTMWIVQMGDGPPSEVHITSFKGAPLPQDGGAIGLDATSIE